MPQTRHEPRRRLTLAQARRLAIAAQGLAGERPSSPGMRHLTAAVSRMGVLQIDSVNVAVRAHYATLYARLGPYPRELLDRAAGAAPRRLVEYWGHEASYLPPATRQLLGFRMAAVDTQAWGSVRRMRDRDELLHAVLGRIERGRATARQVSADLAEPTDRPREHWGWNWSESKHALEYLFYAGRVTAAGRTSQFERIYDLPQRAIPASAGPVVTDSHAAHVALTAIAARAHGVSTPACLRDYFRTAAAPTQAAIDELVGTGELVPVEVDGWRAPAYLDASAAVPRRVAGRTLLCPFDPLIFERARTERLFGFRYRIEIYTPAHKRVHGYYVYPFLLGDRLTARVDLKADRGAGVLRVQAAFAEPDAPPQTAAELAAELRTFAGWLGLSDVAVAEVGDLAPPLARELR